MPITSEQIRLEAQACDDRKLAQVRRMSPAERFLVGAELFEEACPWTKAGICHQYPYWTPEQHRQELRERINLGSS